ncbi:hypothetical protein F5888DRAFT_1835294 [Russula emetica]|nr:hypothetical protein F5888DRAFT_1835294 [Russula emetica]
MSHAQSAAASSSNFQVIISNALDTYRKRTKKDILIHPLAARLQACDTPAAILTILREQTDGLDQSQSSAERWSKWLDPTVNVFFAFSATIGAGIGLIFSPANVIFTGVGVLLSAAKDVRGSQNTILDIFERIEMFFRRLEVYTEVEPTPEMMDMMVQITVEVLSILGIATKEIKQGRTKKYMKRLIGRTDMEDALKKLDKLTDEEARMAVAQNLKATHNVDERVRGVADAVVAVDNRVAGVDDRVAKVDDRVAGVDGRVTKVDDRVAGVDDRVAKVDDRVTGVDSRVACVDDKVAGVDDTAKMVGDKVAEVIHDGREAKMVIQQTANDVDQIKREQLRDNVHKWLSPSDPSKNHNIACRTHHKKTAKWFFQGRIYEEWKSTGSLLWVHGKPGSGKSVLCSSVIQDIGTMCKAGNASMAYFYFDFRDANKQGLRDLVCSFLTQLSAHSAPRCDILSNLYSVHDKGKSQPSDGDLAECLKEMVTLPNQHPIYLIIDALDESPKTPGIPSPRERVLRFVKELGEICVPNLRICVTSRPEIDIRKVLEPLTSRRVSLHDQSGQKQDIVDYVRSVVYSNSEQFMGRWRTDDKELVIKTLSERANGMFRWVFCQLEILRDCLPPSVRRTLDELPESLDETYERVLKEIKKPNRDHAHRLLQCLVVAIRPLGVEELAEVLAVDFDDADGIPKLNPKWRWEDEEQALLASCSSLIVIVESGESRVVQFSHFSVREFLTSTRLATSSGDVLRHHIALEPAHTLLAQACMSILLRSDDGDEQGGDCVGNNSPLARYAAEHWVAHAQFEHVSSYLRTSMESLFDLDKPYFAAWLELYDIDTPSPEDSTFYAFTPFDELGASPLYYAALCGFQDLVQNMIVKYPQHVNASGGWYVTPLVAALAGKHFQTAELLRHSGADLNVQCFNGNTPLHSAAYYGDVGMVQVLLNLEAGVNVLTKYSITVNQLANVARLLLDHGADINTRDNDGWTPLHTAAYCGHIEVVRMLLELGANAGAEEKQGRTPFTLAKERRHDDSEIMKLLSEHKTRP